jgi:hypothetical protein
MGYPLATRWQLPQHVAEIGRLPVTRPGKPTKNDGKIHHVIAG